MGGRLPPLRLALVVSPDDDRQVYSVRFVFRTDLRHPGVRFNFPPEDRSPQQLFDLR